MGLLVNGQWQDQWYDTTTSGGKFIREDSQFRDFISKKHTLFKPESNRYHLYISHACPWAHRTLIYRSLKGLQDHISFSTVDPVMLENGWEFKESSQTEDPLYQHDFLYQLYLKVQPTYSGRVTVPVLWDKQTQTIVNNESSEIIRMLNDQFNHLTDCTDDYYPAKHRKDIDEINDFVYSTINNGVYKCGFATKQDVYEREVNLLFDALNTIEKRLSHQSFLIGETITEADWRLFPTLIRFDAVYVGHFKCNKKRLIDYPNLSRYITQLYNIPGIVETIHFDHIKTHYYASHPMLNPTGIVPVGPDTVLH